MTDYGKNFSQNIRHLRQVYTLTQREMAQILGISAGTLGRIERGGTVRIHSGMLYRICDHFRLSVDAILCENWSEILSNRYRIE